MFKLVSKVQCCMLTIPVFGGLLQEDCKFKASLGNLARYHWGKNKMVLNLSAQILKLEQYREY